VIFAFNQFWLWKFPSRNLLPVKKKVGDIWVISPAFRSCMWQRSG
jgi:hypothetical protein